MAAKFSVIIPVYNRQELIVRTLDSVSSQSWRPLEIIVVDNGSTDETYKRVCEYAAAHSEKDLQIEMVRHQEPGASKARNAGFHHATGDIVAFFDSDDIMSPDTLEAYMKVFEANSKTDMVLSNIGMFNSDNKHKPRKRRSGNILNNHFHHCIICTESFAASRKFLSKALSVYGELWPEHLGVWDDWALGMRLLMMNPRIGRTAHVAAFVEHQSESITGDAYCLTCAERYLAAIADVESTARLHLRNSPRISKHEFSRLKNLTLYRRVMLAALMNYEASRLPESVIRRSPYATRDELEKESRLLLDNAMREVSSAKTRLILQFAYGYVRRGMRGCATIITPFL